MVDERLILLRTFFPFQFRLFLSFSLFTGKANHPNANQDKQIQWRNGENNRERKREKERKRERERERERKREIETDGLRKE